MRTRVALLCLLVAPACRDDDTPSANRPKPVPLRGSPSTPDAARTESETGETGETGGSETGERRVLPERPRADPDIERALDLISGSGLRFIDPPSEPDESPDEYTAEQFAAMLRTKWDWLGYDLTELQPWLDEIATRSFKTNRPYRVLLTDGTTSEVRPWLDAQLAKQEKP